MAQAAVLRQAELNLSWIHRHSPRRRHQRPRHPLEGNLISTSDSLLTSIFQSNPMGQLLCESELARTARGRVSEQNVSGVELILANGQVYNQPGKLNFIASNIDTVLGTQALRAEFANPEQQLLPGQFVRVRLLTGQREGVFLVPQAAVLQTEQANLVMTVDGEGKVAPRPVNR